MESRWPSLLQPDARQLQLFPIPPQPTSAADQLRARLGPEPSGQQTSAELLQQLINLLQPVDVGSLHLLQPGPDAVPAVSQLHQDLLALAPGIFDAHVQSLPSPPQMVDPHSQPASASPPCLANGRTGPMLPSAPAVAAPEAPSSVPRPPTLRHGVSKAVGIGQTAVAPQAAAEVYATYVTQLLSIHERLLTPADNDGVAEESEEDEEGEETDEHSSMKAVAQKQQALLGDVRRLAEETLQMSQAGGALRLIEADLLVQLLCLLQALIRPGCRFISEDEQDASSRMQCVLVAMEAATAALRILTTPDLPQQVYSEDLLGSIVNLTKFHLAHNVYAFHDARFAGTNRPQLGGGEEEAQGKQKSVKKGKKAFGGVRVPRAAKLLQDRCQSVLSLLGELLGVVSLHIGVLVPLARVAMQALTVDGIPLLQGKAVGLLVSAFQHYPASRQAFFDDFFSHVINYFVASKRAVRDFVCSEDSSTSIQMLTAAVLQMIQASVALPAMDTDVKQLPKCYAHAVHWSDYFWSLCFDRLPAARAQKSDTEQDFKLLLEQLLQDLLDVACLPEWPAATVLLLRFITVLSGPKGLQHADGYVRQTCVDFLGMVSARLHQFELAAVSGEGWLQELAGQRGYRDPLEAASALLLSYLADKARGPMACSARQFLLCRAFAEEATSLQRQEAGQQELKLLLASYRKQQDDMSMLPAESAPSSAEARRLTQALVRKTLSNARQSSILWLLDAVEPRQPPTVRAKAVKALGVVVEADPGILEQPEVQKAVEKALQDDSVSVREAALELLGRHIGGNQGLALRLFPILAKACSDTGTSVKKRAIKLLWECCISAPGFPSATEACKHVLMRAGDNEESVQDMVSKVFHSLWFTPRLEAGAAGAAVERSAAQRAQQLADVALAVYEAGGRGIHLPLDLNHPLVVALRSALGFHTKGDLKKEWAAGQEITQALLTAYLQAEEVALAEAGPPANGAAPAQQPRAFPGFRYMLSLHAFAVTDVELCMPASDPARCVKTLAPYLKPPADARHLGQDDQRRGAEELLCVLSVLDDVLSQLPTLDSVDLRDIVLDLVTLINKNPFTVVVGTACKCLCTVASKEPQAAPKLAELVAVYVNLLQRDSVQKVFVSRYLFTLGHLCRYGADVIEATKPESGKEVVTMQGCLALFAGFFQQGAPTPDQQRVQEAALQAIGMLTIARPGIMTHSKAAAKILQTALAPGAPHAFKRTALSNLNEMLRSDEQLLLARQQAADDGSMKGKGRGKQLQNKQGGGSSAVQTQNGQADSLSLSSGILQYHWEMVLRLATDTSTAVGTPSTPSTSASLGVRRQALALIETVLRGGLVAPWTAVAPLVALTTDPNEELRVKALKLLKQEAEKRADFLENKLPAGVVEAYEFHVRLVQTGALRPPRGVLPPEVAAGLQLLYKELVQPNKALRTSFLQNLLKRFDLACTPIPNASGPAASSLGNSAFAPSDLELLRFCAAVAASLPYKRGDEPCSVVYQVNGIVARRGAGLLEDFKAALQSQEQGGNEAALAHCRASVALSMLLVLKDYLKKAYSLSTERTASFGPSGERRKQEERTPVSQLDSVPCHLDKLDLEAAASTESTLQQYKVFKKLMSQDTADYDHLGHTAPPGNRRGGGAKVAESPAAGSPIPGDAADEEAGTPEWVLGNGTGGGPATKLARCGSRKTGIGSSKPTKARAAITTAKATSKKKKRKKSGSDDDPEDEDYTPKAAATKKKLHL